MRELLGRRVSLGALAAAVVALLLATELGVRAVEDWLPVSQAGDAAEVELKWEQVVALDEAGEETDVVFLGSSAMDAAIDPATWATASVSYPRPYNASLLGQPFDSMRRWAGDFVLPRTDPALIIVGVTPFDVPQIDILNTSRAVVEKLFDDAMDRLEDGALSRADRRLADRSAIVRHRSSFRSPIQLVRAARDRVTGEDKPKQDSLQPVRLLDGSTVARTAEVWAEHLMQPRGGVANYWGFTEPTAIGFTFDDPVQQQIFRSSRTTATQLRGFRDLADAADADLVFVIPPTLPEAYTPFTGSQAATDAAEQHLRDVAADLDVEVIDFTEVAYPEGHFADSVHLNRTGSARFSVDLATAVDDL
ncbi:MAG TPA: SGNH/GDSL hydrolase family protein [Iamia sp.]